MRRAYFSKNERYQLEFFFAAFEEDKQCLPNDFGQYIELKRSSNDYFSNSKLKLPLIGEIIDGILSHSHSDYIIYSNVDISLMPNFYKRISELINEGYDAIIVNRKNIAEGNYSSKNLEAIYNLPSKYHPGFDCFVCHRALLQNFNFENIFIGVPFIGIAFAHQIFAKSKKYKLIDREQLTFHIGEKWYSKRAPKQFYKHNQKAFWKIVNAELLDLHHLKKMPYQEITFPIRIIKWILQPSIPIRLLWKLIKKGRF